MCELLYLLVAFFLPLFYYFWTYHYQHWEKKNVVSLEASFPYGSIKDIIYTKTNMINFLGNAYRKYSSSKVVGFYAFRQPMLIVRDLDCIKDILVKDFNSFADNGFQTFASVDPLMGQNVFCIRGPAWKVHRGIHSPAHSVSKLKLMVPRMIQTSMNFVKFLKQQENEICINEFARKYTTDTVATCAFSVENDSFFDQDSVFLKNTYGQLFTDTNLGALTAFFAPYSAFITRARTIQKKAEKFFIFLGKELMEQRKQNNFVGNDLIQHLLSVQEKGEKTGGPVLSTLDVAVHLMTFYLDGSETASLALSHILFEIAAHEDIQAKLRDEINTTGKSPEDFDFSTLWLMNYLEMVMCEALRLHPPIPLLTRICTEEYNLGNIKIEKETKVFIPTFAIQSDPEIYPEPDKFDPERFSPEIRSLRHMATFMPFGEGPRICLGFRYAQTAMKMAIVVLLMNFKLTIPPGRPKKIVPDENSAFVYTSKEDLYIKFEPLNC